MKKKFYFLFAALFSILLSSQTFDWEKTFAGTNDEIFVDKIEDGAGNFIFSGTSNSNDGDLTINYGLRDVFVVKIDAQNGNNVWFSKWNIPTNYLSIDEQVEFSKNIVVYPNPVSEFLNIVLPKDEKLENTKIYNSAGQLIKIEKSKKIDVSSFVKGKYILEIKTNKSVSRKSILVK